MPNLVPMVIEQEARACRPDHRGGRTPIGHAPQMDAFIDLFSALVPKDIEKAARKITAAPDVFPQLEGLPIKVVEGAANDPTFFGAQGDNLGQRAFCVA